MSLAGARKVAKDINGLADLIGIPASEWHNRCHEISLKLLRTGMFREGRVTRGFARGVVGQHSWISLGDPYVVGTPIVDPTIRRGEIVVTRLGSGTHMPHGFGFIAEDWKPSQRMGAVAELAPAKPLSEEAELFLKELGPMDARGWAELVHQPVLGWPSAEIVAAVRNTPSLRAFVPIDIAGHLTGENPGGAYW